jgi:hypothetical protein
MASKVEVMGWIIYSVQDTCKVDDHCHMLGFLSKPEPRALHTIGTQHNKSG